MALELSDFTTQALQADVRAEIPLSEFSKLFFPMFAAYFAGHDAEIGRWFLHTKTAGFTWVDVVENGNVVFSVPPVLSTGERLMGEQLHQDPADILKIAALKDRTLPGSGNAHIRHNLIEQIDYSDGVEKKAEDFMEAWNKIFAYYGYTLDEPKADTPNIQDNFDDEDFDGYADL